MACTRLPIFSLILILCISMVAGGRATAQPGFGSVPEGTYQVWTTESNVEVVITNYGPFGVDLVNERSGLFWPAGSGRRYGFGGGFWFGARKFNADSGMLIRLCLLGYNPNTGLSWFTPGRAETPTMHEAPDLSADGIRLNRLYNSTEYVRSTGAMMADSQTNPLWPIWLDSSRVAATPMYAGTFITDPEQRIEVRNNGWTPGFYADGDFFAVFRDNFLDRYEIEGIVADQLGYPLGIEVQNRIFTWSAGVLKDAVVLTYECINRSNDTLYDCYFSPVHDIDIGHSSNDKVASVIPERDRDTLNMVQAWSDVTQGDKGYGFLGIDMVATPAVDENGFLRTDRTFYPPEEQIGLNNIRAWVIENDPQTIVERYDFMASTLFDRDSVAGDKRILISSGPFTMLPGDTARFAIAYLFADGTSHDNLIALSSYLQQRWDRGMRAVSSVRQLGEIIRRLNLE